MSHESTTPNLIPPTEPREDVLRGALVALVVVPLGVAAWLLVFLYSLHELTVSSLLYVPGTETIGVVVLNAEEGGDLATTSAIALWLTIVILLCAVPLIVSRRLRGILGFSSGGSW